MANRLVLDIDEHGQASVIVADGGLPEQVGDRLSLTFPMDADELADLRWYLEDYLRAPFSVYESRGAEIANRLPAWGKAMFSAFFASGPARDAYVRLRDRAEPLEVVVRSPHTGWLGVPWELMRDPNRPAPLALDGVQLSRSLPSAQLGKRFEVSGDRLRVLMVISRPRGHDDVGYQMIARPLLERLAAVRGQVDLKVLRPPTLSGLVETLRASDPFQIVHFDGHGVSTGGLAFEDPAGGTDHVPAERIAQVLAEAKVPVVVLNACQSGAVGKELEAAVATRLLAGGASAVVAMAYNVYAVAAAEFITAFYERLFAGETVGEAVRAGRAQMGLQPHRPSPKGDLPLADWAIPVHYLRQDVRFPDLKPTTTPRREARTDDLAPVGEFFGRDELFYSLELAARTQRVIILHGPAGTGKTEAAKAFGRWWRDTDGVEQPEWVIWHSFAPGVASFGLDGVLSTIGLTVFGERFALLDNEQRRATVLDLLATRRVLVIWDNFESVASARDELKDFLADIAPGGRGTVLITSRTKEDWLGDRHRIAVGGLNRLDANQYADHLLAHLPNARKRRSERPFAELMEWLNGHPLSMRVVLPSLETREPAAILASLKGNGERIDSHDNLLSVSLSYSISQLDADTRRLLTVVCLFEGVTDANVLRVFAKRPSVPERFRGIDDSRWLTVFDAAAQVGLLTPFSRWVYRIHPALPAWLADEWRAASMGRFDAERAAAEDALLDAYAAVGVQLYENFKTSNAALALLVLGLQRRTMGRLLSHALKTGRWVHASVLAQSLGLYWDHRGLVIESKAWVDRVRLLLDEPDGTPPPLDSEAGRLWLVVVGAEASRLIDAGHLDAAEQTFKQIHAGLRQGSAGRDQRRHLAATLQQLGYIAHERRRLDEADQWYRQALDIAQDIGDRTNIAGCYHRLGGVAESRGLFDEAERWYRQALAVNQESGDQTSIARGYAQLGMIALLRGQLDAAEQWFREALGIAELLGDLLAKARLLHDLSRVAFKGNRLAESEQLSRQALTLAAEFGDRPTMATCYQQLGMVAHAQRRLADAEAWYRQALGIDKELGSAQRLASDYHQLGGVALYRGRLEEAEELYRQALAIGEQLDDPLGRITSYGQLGTLAERRGKLDEALDWMIRCVTVLDGFPHEHTGPAPAHLARFAHRLGLATLEQRWQHITNRPLPDEVRAFVENLREDT